MKTCNNKKYGLCLQNVTRYIYNKWKSHIPGSCTRDVMEISYEYDYFHVAPSLSVTCWHDDYSCSRTIFAQRSGDPVTTWISSGRCPPSRRSVTFITRMQRFVQFFGVFSFFNLFMVSCWQFLHETRLLHYIIIIFLN